MARATYVMRDGVLVDVREAPPLHATHGSAPNVISDSMSPIQSMADGKMYDSKSTYQRSVKAAGCIVVGNDSSVRNPTIPEYRSAGSVGHDVKRAIEQLKSR